jgi:hypothetical protein
MGRRCYTATVDRVAMGTDNQQNTFREYLWLTDITDGSGVPFAGERWLNHSPTLVRLELRPGDRIGFEASIRASLPHKPPLWTSIDDPAAFLADMAAQGIDTVGVIFRLATPTRVTVNDSEPTRRTTSRSRANW